MTTLKHKYFSFTLIAALGNLPERWSRHGQ